MNLRGSITGYQNRLSKLYLKLKQRFSENNLIGELWGAMARDISQQVISLNGLPRSFWNQIKNGQDGLSEAIYSACKNQTTDNKEDLSLKACFEMTLQVEEPTILNIYVPLIRRLRENWTDQALDFYIMVKAHLARITRIIEAFSGDPLIVHRSNSLLGRFEKEVQEPPVPAVLPVIRKKQAVAREPAKKKKLKQRQPSPRPMLKLVKHAKIRPGRTKPIMKKIVLRRGRAR